MDFKQEHLLGIIAVLLLALVGGGLYVYRQQGSGGAASTGVQFEEAKEPESGKTQESADEEIVVYVTGEVKNSGVFSLRGEARVIDALKLAGGETGAADLEQVNLAAPVYDGDKIHIPAVNRNPADSATGKSSGTGDEADKIALNRADSQQLQELSGIGPSKAESIIDYREELGRFEDKQQLLEVSGIGPKTLDKIRDELTLR